jgi:1-acyl-sn-glycerol-3-phosphate acyltransferase
MQPKSDPAPDGIHSPLMRAVGIPILRLVFALCFLVLGPVRAYGKRRVPKQGGLLVLSNHLADVDPIVVQMACPRPVHFMAKSELFEMRVVGPLLRFYKAFPVKRGEPDKGSIKHCVKLLQRGEVVGIFPEGQLSEDGRLQELKPGVALIIKMAQVPVICVRIQNTNAVLPYGKLFPRPSFKVLSCRWSEPRSFSKEDSQETILQWAAEQLSQVGEGRTSHPV